MLSSDLDSAVKVIGDAEFEYIELWGEVPHAYHDFVDEKRLVDTLSAYDMTVTLHAPFTDLNPSSPFEPVRGAIAKSLAGFVKFGERLGVPFITFHPGSVYNQALAKESMRNAATIFNGLVKQSAGTLTICLENQAASSSKYDIPVASTLKTMEQLLSEVEGARFTLDTGHAHVSGIDPLAMANKVGSKLVEVHLSDNTGTADDHLIPGEGTASLQRLLDKLVQTDVLICLELNPHRYTPDQVMSASLRIREELKGKRRP